MEAFLHFVENEWYFAIPMFCMSLTAIALVLWRILLNVNANTNMEEFLPRFQQKLQKEGPEGALRMCRAEPGLIPSRLLTAGLENARQGLGAMRRAMSNSIELDILPRLNFLLAPILAIAKIATMVGLLGTVISMINTFNELSKVQGTDPGNVTGHSQAIGLALFATALGLMTAIPLVFAHVLFKDWIAKFEVKMKSAGQKLQALVQSWNQKKSGSTQQAASPPAVTPAKPVTPAEARR